MPWLHKYLGNPVLSWIGRLFFHIEINDFHCGLRGFNREAVENLHLSSTGMEFASEMVVKASLDGLKITEVPTILRPDGRSRAPHLRTWRDGWRHLIFLLMASPRWLFLYPGIFLLALGFLGTISTGIGAVHISGIQFNLNTYFLSVAISLAGLQTILLAILARVFATKHGMLPRTQNISKFENYFSLERGIVASFFLFTLSAIGAILLISDWTGSGFNNISIYTSFRISGFFVLTFIAGIQILFASFFASMLRD